MQRLGNDLPSDLRPVLVICALVRLNLGVREHVLDIAYDARTHRQQVGVARFLHHADKTVRQKNPHDRLSF